MSCLVSAGGSPRAESGCPITLRSVCRHTPLRPQRWTWSSRKRADESSGTGGCRLGAWSVTDGHGAVQCGCPRRGHASLALQPVGGQATQVGGQKGVSGGSKSRHAADSGPAPLPVAPIRAPPPREPLAPSHRHPDPSRSGRQARRRGGPPGGNQGTNADRVRVAGRRSGQPAPGVAARSLRTGPALPGWPEGSRAPW